MRERRLLIDFVCIDLGGCLILDCWFGICIKCTFGLGFCGSFAGGLYGLLINGLLLTFCCGWFVVCGWCILGDDCGECFVLWLIVLVLRVC